MNYKDITIRAVKTFAQAFVAFVSASGLDFAHISKWSFVEKVLVSACVAGASAVWNVVLVPIYQPVKARLGL